MSACPECGDVMHPIHLLDQGHAGVHGDLEYAAVDAKRSRWSGRYPVSGRVHATMCSACGRIVLRGEPPTELAPSNAPAGNGDEVAST